MKTRPDAARVGLLSFGLALLAACGGDEDVPGPGSPSSASSGAGGSGACPPGHLAVGEIGAEGEGCQPAGIPPAQCAAGFAPDERDGCRPILPSEPCSKGLMAVPGETSCREVAPCGAAPWGNIPVDAATEYVDGSYAGADSDGTPTRPWTTVQAGIDAAGSGAIVAVAAGSYAEDVEIGGTPVRLWGLCPAEVEIVGSAAAVAAVFVQNGAAGSEIRDLAVRGVALGVAISGSEGVALDRVWIHDLSDRALVVQDDLGPTRVDVTGSLIEAATELGVFVAGSEATIEATVVRETKGAGSEPRGGRGVDAQDRPTTGRRANVILRSSLVEKNGDVGVFVWGSDATIEATVVRETQPRLSDATSGWGIAIQDHPETGQRSAGSIRGCVVDRNHDAAVLVSGSDATIEATVVRDTMPRASDGKFGRGITIKQDPTTGERATVTVRSCVVDRNSDVGMFVWGADATIESTIVRETQPRASDLASGRGIQLQVHSDTGARATAAIRGSLVEWSFDLGIVVAASDATVDGTLVRGTMARASDGAFGDGLVVVSATGPASVAVTASRVEGSARAGVGCFGASASIGTTTLECNAIDLDAESFVEAPPSLSDAGGNVCGCAGEEVPCQVLTTNLEPPAPLPPVEQGQ